MKIACISDLHISSILNDNSDYLDDFLYNLQDYSINHLLICGDIVGTISGPSVTGDFKELRKILNHYGWYDPWRCTIVPGNHDMRWIGHFDSTQARTFRQIFPKLFIGGQKYNQDRYIITKMLRSCAIIGLDTATDNGPQSFHAGLLGPHQINELERLQGLKAIRERRVILAMHHLPQSSDVIDGVLEDADQFWEVVDSDIVDLIVCGHVHESYELDNLPVPVVCVGGFTNDN